ncbi:MAG TPA: hypothetical protein PKE69_01025 [Pyrinomonadaceae bacterium]|nr:hypothetical protein [Pyrinomonadaceae bacterium]
MSSRTGALPAVTLKRLTPDRNVFQPTISPDGKYLVYAAQEKEAGKTLRLKDLTSGSEVQIMPESSEYSDLAFSSDGKQIYYLTSVFGGPNLTLARIPLFGGKPQIILKNVVSPPAISPDCKRIAIIKLDTGWPFHDLRQAVFADVLVAGQRARRHLRKKRGRTS